ncbi:MULTISPECIES: hypothetical protein [Actinomycetes]|uniref:hypothetical protein n=1 Tax=Actinomycetes TaxID=1760 RepID=UPI000A9E1E6E|nr:hypothetical protein [Microbacterium profundi]
MQQANDLDDLANVPVDHEVARAGDATHRRADLVATGPQMKGPQADRKVVTFA